MKLHEAETEKFNIKQMKDLFEQKAAQLATEIVGKGRLGLATFFFSQRKLFQTAAYFNLCYLCFIPDIKSRMDEEKSLREVAEQKVASLQQDLQRERQEKDKLETELVDYLLHLLTHSCQHKQVFVLFTVSYHYLYNHRSARTLGNARILKFIFFL